MLPNLKAEDDMWQTKIFETREAMNKWLAKHESRIQWEEVYINNAYGLTYRPLRIV